MYKISFTIEAEKDLALLKKNTPVAFKKVVKLLDELVEHPYTGTGHPKPLGSNKSGQWSRRITDKHRLVYEVIEKDIVVLVLSAYGHYDDK